jgi:hypothetical protein
VLVTALILAKKRKTLMLNVTRLVTESSHEKEQLLIVNLEHLIKQYGVMTNGIYEPAAVCFSA